MHCASLLPTIFASLAHANERVPGNNDRNFPHAKLDSETNARSLLNERGNLEFYGIIIVYILSSLIKKIDVGESVHKTVTLGCKL